MDANPSDNAALGQQFLRTAWLFQGVCSLPTLLILGGCAFNELFYPYVSYYRFVTYTVNAIFAGGIIFIVLMQRKLGISNIYLTTVFELGKSVLGTAMWVWLMLDSACYNPGYYYNPRNRLTRAALAFIVLPTIFYPTALYTVLLKSKENGIREREESGGLGPTSDERTPLLHE